MIPSVPIDSRDILSVRGIDASIPAHRQNREMPYGAYLSAHNTPRVASPSQCDSTGRLES
jgi:hypothetical protein